MDPVTHAALGAVLPPALLRSLPVRSAALLGATSALAPDLDVLISSSSDPLLALEMHRHFTHALLFAPFGALVCCALLFGLVRKQMDWNQAWLCCLLGFASHALLDACTPWGTPLLWPFSQQRFAWNLVADVDPLVTLPLLILAVIAVLRRRVGMARMAATWLLALLAFGWMQSERAARAASVLARERGHEAQRLWVMPSFANSLVWKTVYVHDGNFHVDAIRSGWRLRVYPGGSTPVLDTDRFYPWLDAGSQQATDLQRFEHMALGLLSPDHRNPNLVWDLRYSLLPDEVEGSLGVMLDPGGARDAHARLPGQRPMTPAKLSLLWDRVLGR